MRIKKVLLVVVFCVAISACPLLYGQANGSLSGTVSDKAGAVVAGATVRVTSQGTGVSREANTNDSGYYLIPLLPVAFYTIHVESPGFQATEQKDIRLQVDEHREVDFTLAPASVSTAVQVSATEVAVETANPTLGQVITSEEVADLPLNGRNFVQLATLTPGTTSSTNPQSFFNGAPSSEASTRGTFSLSVGGSREQSTDWLLDGNDNNQLDEGGIAIFSSIDDIQEFKVLTYNYSAEYGERAGPTVLVTTKSGSNQWHGSLFEFFRNTALNTNEYFTQTQQKFNLNQFGGSLGGAIRKDKTFFFLDYQAKMQRQGVTYPGYVPTQNMVTPDANGNYDYTDNPFATQLINPFTPIQVLPNSNGAQVPVPFQCLTGTSTPETPVNGSQPYVPGTTQFCDIIPAALVNQSARKSLRSIPRPMQRAPSASTTLTSSPESSTRAPGTSVSTTIFRARTPPSGASATIRQRTSFREVRRRGRSLRPSAAISSSTITDVTWLFPKLTYFRRIPSISSVPALAAFSTTFFPMEPEPAKRRSSEFPEPIWAANATPIPAIPPA